MLIQSTFFFRPIITKGTCVRSLIGMGTEVVGESTTCCRPIITKGTRKRSLIGMGTEVDGEMTFCCRPIITKDTRKRSLIGMRTEVVGESTLMLISPPTTLPGTHKWIVPCMDPNMVFQRTLLTKSLSTPGMCTAKGFLLQMNRVDVLDDICPFL